MPGAFMQLVATGPQDVYLTGNPQTTFFKTAYRRHTNFSMECIKVEFKTNPAPNQRVIATIDRRGDLVHDCFIKTQTDLANTGNNPGHNMIDYIECEIGGRLIDRHYGHWMEAHAELTEEAGFTNAQFLGYGNNETMPVTTLPSLPAPLFRADIQVNNPNKFQLTAAAGGVIKTTESTDVNVMVPLRFWFCRHIGLSLPLVALQYHEVNINIKFSDGDGVQNFFQHSNKGPDLWCNYIYLDTDERRRYAQVSHEYLIEQVQVQSFTTVGTTHTIKLNFNHPVKELIWGNINIEGGNWGAQGAGSFDILHQSYSLTTPSTIQLKLNGHDRFEKIEPEYFTRYQIYKYHTGIPFTKLKDGISVYSFALKPEEHQPSGTCNFSRIDNAELIFSNLNPQKLLYIYAVNYNILRIMSGMGGLAYSN